MTSSVLVTVGWAGWHVPAFFYLPGYTAMSAPLVAGFVIGLLSGAIVLTWLYNASGGSVLAAMLWHASFNFVTASTAIGGTSAAVTSMLVILWAIVLVWRNDWATLATHAAASRSIHATRDATQPEPFNYCNEKRYTRPEPSRVGRRVEDVNWFGATRRETELPLTGDDLIPTPMLDVTHAMTVHAPADRIWPWLVQIGQGRAGFYADSRWWDAIVDFYYRVLSRERGQPRVHYQRRDTEITPGWQHLSIGDAIADGPPGTAHYVVRCIEPGRSLVLFTDTHLPYAVPSRLRPRVAAELTVVYLLLPLGQDDTRVLRRMRMTCRPMWFRVVIVPILLLWGELITARHFLRGLRRRAEAIDRLAPSTL